MSSFIDLMGNVVWSEADIVNRTEAVIASQFPPARVAILNRKVTGMILGQYTMTPDEQTEMQAYAIISFQAGQEADSARADMALLTSARAVEAARARLALDPVADPEDPAYAADQAQRAAAQADVGGAGADTLALVAQRAACRIAQ